MPVERPACSSTELSLIEDNQDGTRLVRCNDCSTEWLRAEKKGLSKKERSLRSLYRDVWDRRLDLQKPLANALYMGSTLLTPPNSALPSDDPRWLVLAHRSSGASDIWVGDRGFFLACA